MIKISKIEMNMLLDKGFTFGADLHKTHTRYPHYYVTEGSKVMSVLNKYRESKIQK